MVISLVTVAEPGFASVVGKIITVSVQLVQPVGPPGMVVGKQVLPKAHVPVTVTSLVTDPVGSGRPLPVPVRVD